MFQEEQVQKQLQHCKIKHEKWKQGLDKTVMEETEKPT